MTSTMNNRLIKRIWNLMNFHRRKSTRENDLNEIHQLISNVYESIDDQARAVLLIHSRILQDEDKTITIDEKVRALLNIGHTLCFGDIFSNDSLIDRSSFFT